MKITHLQATDFRNFDRLEVELRPGINFFLGENGQGKTNLIEAVHVLCRGSSFRPSEARVKNLLQFERSRAAITGLISKKSLDFSVQIALENGRKAATVNGKHLSCATLSGYFPVVLFSPESLSVIKEGPEHRRQLVDEIVLSHKPAQSHLIDDFKKALKGRNRLLKTIASSPIEALRDELHVLEGLNKIFLLLATHLSFARIQALRAIQPDFIKAMTSIVSDGSGPTCAAGDISVDYVISGQSAMLWDESQVFDALHKRAAELHNQERAAGISLVGPQKHDIKLLFDGNDSRFYSSQGQQRALILALKIAQIVYHQRTHETYPVLLLDDVLSELDLRKRVNLMKFLEGISAQILITATDLTWSDQVGFDHNSIFTVSGGRVQSRRRKGFETPLSR